MKIKNFHNTVLEYEHLFLAAMSRVCLKICCLWKCFSYICGMFWKESYMLLNNYLFSASFICYNTNKLRQTFGQSKYAIGFLAVSRKMMDKNQFTKLILVAVVRSWGGNQAAEMAGGAAMTVMPDNPFRIAQMWLIMVNVKVSSDNDL